MRAFVVSSTDLRDTTVRSHDYDRCTLHLKRAIEKREALDVEHVHLVDEEYARNDFRLAFFAPLRHLSVDLLTNFLLDLTGVTREQRQKTLLSGVDHVDFVQVHGVNNLLPLLKLAVRALHEARLRAHRVVVFAARETLTQQ